MSWATIICSVAAEASLAFTVRPFFWQTHWFRLGVAALCLMEGLLVVALLALLRQRKKVERALQESERRLNLAAEAANVGFWSMDLRSHRVWVSERARQLYGMAPEEPLTYQTLLDRVHPEDHQRVEAAVQRVAQGHGQLREYYRVTHPNGDLRWMLAIGSLTTGADRRPRRLMGAWLDVTERKMADEALRREQALTGAVFDSVPGILYLYTAEGQLIRWNKKHEELTGYSAAELADFKASDWFEGEDLAIMKREWERVFSSGQASAELNLVVKDGSRIPYLLTGVRLEIDGKPHLVGMGIDISHLRRAEWEAQELRRDLEHSRRVALLGELSGSLAHELNQPLAAILANAQAARRWLAGGQPDLDELRALIEDIVRDDKRAGEIVHRVRALAKKEASERQRLDVNHVVRETATLLRSELIAAKVPLVLELHPDLPAVKTGHVELQQSLLNLMLNGLQAQPATEPSRRALTVATQLSADRIILSVRDRGPGLSPDVTARLFESFFTTKPGGMGLGLAFCRRFAETHGGKLWAENHPEGGAVFFLSLPVSEPGS